MGRTATSVLQSAEQSRIAEIAQQLYDLRSVAYFCIDRKWVVYEHSSNLIDLGFEGIGVGVNSTDVVDFMVGVDINSKIELPLLSSPTKVPISVSLLPDDNGMTVLICDAAEEFVQRSQLQQKANENQILLETQAKLMSKLEVAQQQLSLQNQQLREAARIQSGFMSGFSHEFRTPLNSIIGHVKSLQKSLEHISESSVGHHLSALQRSSKHMLSLVENLLDYGKFDSNEIDLHPQSIKLIEAFHDIELLLEQSAVSKNIELKTRLNFPSDLMVLIDDGRLRQCLLNLVGNAIKFTDQGEVTVEAQWQNDVLTVKIQDTGIGISSEHLTLVSTPFWQAPNTGKAGTGLGLTITSRIVELMGGDMMIESVPGQGSEVRFSILAPKIDAQSIAQNTDQFKSLQKLRVLFAEDDDDAASLTMAMLEEYGVNIKRVINGQRAVIEVAKRDYDLVLMDVHMPVMDGFAAAEVIRETGNQVPIVVMTASSSESDRSRAQQLACDGYLVKPVEIRDLLALSSQIIANR